MRKDYIAADADSGGNEADFVDRYWTAVWKDSLARGGEVEEVARRAEFKIMLKHLRRLPAGARILDAGCGLGAWTVKLAALGYDVTGLDLSREVIARLTAVFPDRKFVAGDIRQTGFAGGSFDACFSWGAFEHFEIGPGPCLAEVHRILKPGGGLFVSVPFHNGRLWRRDKLPLPAADKEFAAQRGYTQPMRFYQWRFTVQELRRECELMGFEVQALHLLHKQVGVHRLLVTDLELKLPPLVESALRTALSWVLPGAYIAHMVMAVARKR